MEERTRKGSPRRMGPGAPGAMRGEKIKKGTWGKLLKYTRKYWVFVIIAVICAAGGTIFTLAGPDKLSEMTDTVTEGIAPDTDMLEEISTAMQDSVSENSETLQTAVSDNVSANMQTVMTAISENLAKGSTDAVEVNGVSISVEEQTSTLQIMSSADQQDQEAMSEAMNTLPESVKAALYSDVEVNGVTISGEDQVAMQDAFADMDTEDTSSENQEEALNNMKDLPESVKAALYTEITVDGTRISGEDQLAMIDILSNIDEDDTEATLEAFDELPESIYDLVKPTVDLDKIFEIAMFLVILYVAGCVLSATQGFIMATVTQKVSKKLRTDISEKINRLPMGYYHRHSTGDVLSRVTNDVDMLGASLNMSIGMLVSAITLFVGSLIMMLKTNVTMTITGILATIIGFALMMVIMGHSQKYFTRQQKHLGELNGHIEEMYTGHTVVKAYNGEEDAIEEFHRLNGMLKDSGFKAQAMSGLMMPIMTFIGNFGYVAVCLVGAALAMDGKISFGVIVSFMMYIRFFTQPLSQLAQASQQLQSAGASASRVFEFLDAEEMEDESNKTATLTDTKGNVSFSHVHFGYDPDKIIINDFSAEAKAGQKIAIVGPTGAGKSTLINLLMRFYEINSGEIKIDGVPIASMKREEVHSQFCMVLQDTWLFEGTVRENLIYCSENKSEEKMKEACKAVGLDHFIHTLPKGYDTVLDDQVNLSQGQKQQLTIARAMIADKPILILDEATSSIDTRTELQIQHAMDELMKGRTSFVIAHRLSTIKDADLILVLKDGDVIESGNHEELMEQKGFYADLYNSQFEQAS